MNISDAKSRFLAFLKQDAYDATVPEDFEKTVLPALELFTSRFANRSIDELPAADLRDFLSRWYVEEASAQLFQHPQKTTSSQQFLLPPAQPFIEALSAFFKWYEELSPNNLVQEHLAVLRELQDSLPRAIEISRALLKHLANRGGAIQFPEFLTSFEAGGHSEYDIGEGSAVGALEGYFRVLRIEGVTLEAEEVITEARIYPIIFPEAIAALLQVEYLINLEIVRTPEAWQIVGGGFAYPPNTEI
jgi:hypothetical protein